MGTFIEALKEIADLDMLFYTSPGSHYSLSQISELERTLGAHWNAEIRLFLSPMSEYRNGTKFEKLISFGKGLFSIFKQHGYFELSGEKQIQALEDCLERKPDAIFAHRLPSMCPLMLTRKPLPPIFFDFDDIEHIVLSRSAEQQKSLKSKRIYLLIPALKSGERKALNLAAETYVCSEKDRAYIAREFPRARVFIIPNSVNLPELHPPSPYPNVLFLGSDYGPNFDAAEFLAEKIWPYIHAQAPEARLIIAGISPDKLKICGSSATGIEVHGFVEDIDSLYERSSVIAVPILVGGGTRYKIIEAAAYGKPVVSTSRGAEGIELAHGTDILIRDDPESFAATCVDLLRDPALCEKIGGAARAQAAKLYDRNAVVNLIRNRIVNKIK
jgi:glycosyltransferase involved in cell wall biosynthesis